MAALFLSAPDVVYDICQLKIRVLLLAWDVRWRRPTGPRLSSNKTRGKQLLVSQRPAEPSEHTDGAGRWCNGGRPSKGPLMRDGRARAWTLSSCVHQGQSTHSCPTFLHVAPNRGDILWQQHTEPSVAAPDFKTAQATELQSRARLQGGEKPASVSNFVPHKGPASSPSL